MVVYQVPNLKAPHHYAKMVRFCLCSAAILVTKKSRFGGIRSCVLGSDLGWEHYLVEVEDTGVHEARKLFV